MRVDLDTISMEELMANGGRLLVVSVLQHMPYDEYLLTNHWQEKRRYFFGKYGGLCCWCGNPGCEVHHLNYDNIGCEHDEDCILLCTPHHVLFHKNWQLKVRREGQKQFAGEAQ